MSAPIFLFTPPFTQINTPYPATAYLKGFLNTKGIRCYQADLGIEVTLKIFCADGLAMVFDRANELAIKQDENLRRIALLSEEYKNTIDAIIRFLQGKDLTLANLICTRNFLPEAGRFAQLDAANEMFGALGLVDKAKHIATLYLEDISDFIKGTVDAQFGFSRYAEKLGISANTFDELYAVLQQEYSFIDDITTSILKQKIDTVQPQLVGMSVPFPGNLYSAFRCAQWIKQHYPKVKIVMGGGFPNTELRSLSDERVFEFFDFISIDDGEAPLENIWNYIQQHITLGELKRTFALHNNVTTFINNASCTDYKQHQVGTPDYSDLLLTEYINAIEVVNPMHKLWSDGRWNKLTMAHGCYWGKCTFCDISLPYIKDYEPLSAALLCDRMEAIIAQTNTTGFHFVDEAAPPALMRNLAIEIVKRKLKISWWTNVRFEKSFTQDLCYLLAASGCIAVSGGLEVASDRLLQLIDKGITVKQVAKVTSHFTKAGIMVHAYLMYGYPTQTNQETVDSLEMVRQLFEAGVVQSGFWHRFAMTSHSPIGLQPNLYHVIPHKAPVITFADNDVAFTDTTGGDHDMYTFGLQKSLLNYMHQAHFDKPLQYWFDHKIPTSTVNKNYITNCIVEEEYTPLKPTAKVLWLGTLPTSEVFTQTKKGMQREMLKITFNAKRVTRQINLPKEQGIWLIQLLQKINIHYSTALTWRNVMEDYVSAGLDDFELFWYNKPMNKLNELGLLVV